jgi:hypothetical protein
MDDLEVEETKLRERLAQIVAERDARDNEARAAARMAQAEADQAAADRRYEENGTVLTLADLPGGAGEFARTVRRGTGFFIETWGPLLLAAGDYRATAELAEITGRVEALLERSLGRDFE